MKKYLIIITIIMLLIPCNVNGVSTTYSGCDYKNEVELNKLASKITYDRVFNKDSGTFTVTLYNVISDLHVSYDGGNYFGDENNEVVFTNIEQGTYMNIITYSNSISCYSSLMTIYVTLPYYNYYYGSEECEDYDEILTVCNSQFLTYKIDEIILKEAINNYNNKIYNEPEPEPIPEKTVISGIKEFVSLWGLKIGLVVATIGLAVWYFQVKLRKTIHGI